MYAFSAELSTDTVVVPFTPSLPGALCWAGQSDAISAGGTLRPRRKLNLRDLLRKLRDGGRHRLGEVRVGLPQDGCVVDLGLELPRLAAVLRGCRRPTAPSRPSRSSTSSMSATGSSP